MKKLSKKLLALVLALSLCMAMGAPAFAGEKEIADVESPSEIATGLSQVELDQKAVESIEMIQVHLAENGTTVEAELSTEQIRLKVQLATETDIEKKAKIEKLISEYANMLANYQVYLNQTGSRKNGIESRTSVNFLDTAVTAIVSVFLQGKFAVSAELLTHAHMDHSGADYYPALYTNIYTSLEFKILKNRCHASGELYIYNGSVTFEKGSTVADNDLYYSIHGCRYTYDRERAQISFHDYYDYDFNPDAAGLAGQATNTMYLAQVEGIIVPYDLYIETNI